jgi:hypothetical protein
MNQVAPQVDVGTLTINGLAAFSPVLAILSADNVTPLAMVQMENLGSIFHINGEYAQEVPNLLQRYSSTRLDRLGILIGWRKGDAASLMAKSAGGQAISLFATCLLSLYSPSDAGQILHELSLKVLPPTIAISSVSQLVDVAKLVGSKLETLGFGNVLARQVTKVHAAYEHLGKPVPSDFLDNVSMEAAVELFHALSRAAREESTVVRITGSQGMGHVLGLVMMMFPQDAFVTLDNLIIHDGASKSILIEFGDFGMSTQIHVESKIRENSIETNLPIAIDPRGRDQPKDNYCFQWPGWISDMLQLAFLDVGLTCPKAICNTCCDLLMLLPTAMGSLRPLGRTDVHIPHNGYESLLGPYPNERMYQICQTVWRTDPDYLPSSTSLAEAYTTLQSAMTEATRMVCCSCQAHEKCYDSLGWEESRNNAKRTCKVHRVWTAIGSSLHYGFACFFVNASSNATIIHPKLNIGWGSIADFITNELKEKSPSFGGCGDLRTMVMSMMSSGRGEIVAASSNSSTLYPTALRTLALPREMNGQYSLVEGRLINNGQYHNSLRHNVVKARPLAKKPLLSHKPSIAPSCGGEHSDLLITVRECFDFLEMKTMVRVGGSTVHLNLGTTIIASWGLEETRPCEHSSLTPLDPDDCKYVITTSVASPSASKKKIAIAQVQGNSIAQLLCCTAGTRSLIQTDCCLHCALEQAEGRFGMIIVR